MKLCSCIHTWALLFVFITWSLECLGIALFSPGSPQAVTEKRKPTVSLKWLGWFRHTAHSTADEPVELMGKRDQIPQVGEELEQKGDA